jgi:hypothetical protein
MSAEKIENRARRAGDHQRRRKPNAGNQKPDRPILSFDAVCRRVGRPDFQRRVRLPQHRGCLFDFRHRARELVRIERSDRRPQPWRNLLPPVARRRARGSMHPDGPVRCPRGLRRAPPRAGRPPRRRRSNPLCREAASRARHYYSAWHRSNLPPNGLPEVRPCRDVYQSVTLLRARNLAPLRWPLRPSAARVLDAILVSSFVSVFRDRGKHLSTHCGRTWVKAPSES